MNQIASEGAEVGEQQLGRTPLQMPALGPLTFDMRSPDFGAKPAELYHEALEMAAFADSNGFEAVGFSEHHGADDGYLPSSFVMASAVAARTSRVRLVLSAVSLPLHDPVRVAEDLAVLDLVSNGRAELVAGVGYMPSEYRRFNLPNRPTGVITSEYLQVIRRALSGERFEFYGREVYVRPLPVQEPHPPMWVGGSVEASALRAARFADGFMPHSNFDAINPVYLKECEALGKVPGPIAMPLQPLGIYVAEDPDRAWSIVGPHVLHVVNTYAAWAEEGSGGGSPFQGLVSLDDVRNMGIFQIATPDEAAARIIELRDAGSHAPVWPLIGGLSPQHGWESLELIVNKVMPRLAERAAIA